MWKASQEKMYGQFIAGAAVVMSLMSVFSIGGDLRWGVLVVWGIAWLLLYEACSMYEGVAEEHIKFASDNARKLTESESKLNEKIRDLRKKIAEQDAEIAKLKSM